MIYADITDFWMKRAEHAERAASSAAQPAASDKDVKLRVLEFIDAANAFHTDETRQWVVLRHASESIVNTIDPGLAKCSALQRDALSLRGELLRRVPTIYRGSAATGAYESAEP